MAYAFEYHAYNKGETDSDGYRDKKEAVTVTVKAEDEQEAETAAKLVLTREIYKLDSITELSEDLMPIKPCGY